MINRFLLLFLLLSLHFLIKAQSTLPVDTLNSRDAFKPLVFYITGDGGFNSFSTSFMQQWNEKGYPVLALNAKSYFWKTKQPDAAAKEIASLLTEYLARWHRAEIILAGYSFGADVLPFIERQLPAAITFKIKHIVLVSPSQATDFTIHLFYSSGGSNVPAEINRLNVPVLITFGKEETDTPVAKISNHMATIMTLPGDHHYNNQVAFLTNEIVKRM